MPAFHSGSPRREISRRVPWLEGKNIATSYPNIVKAFLDKNNVRAGIHEISGSVEIAPGIGLADAICDIVSTGSTLLSNGLREVSYGYAIGSRDRCQSGYNGREARDPRTSSCSASKL